MTVRAIVLILHFLAIFVVMAAAFAAEKPTSFVGTVNSVSADATELQIQRDNAALPVKIGAETLVQRIAPGEKSLANAQPFPATEIRAGDRVLVSMTSDSTDARRIVVMAATDISRRNEADKQDWIKRGLTGIVTAKDNETIKLRKHSMAGDSELIVTVTDKTGFKRYAPDSVKFADARASKLAEVQIGDQLRARGDKSADGTKVTAEDVVFGTFLTSAGKVTALDAPNNQVRIEDLKTKKPTLIRITDDSKLKKMPALQAMGGASGGPMLSGSPMMGGGPPGMGGGPPPDLAQMIEMMPVVKLDELKPGDTIIVSSTKGAHDGEVTAIMVLANADMLIQMASARANNGRSGSAQQQGTQGGQGGMQGAAGMGSMGALSLGGLELPSMIQ